MYNDMRTVSSPMLTNRARASSEVTSLLTRYPNLSEAQLARLINLYQDLPLLDSALLQTDRAIARGLGAIVADHRQINPSSARYYAALLLLAGTAAALLMTVVVTS